MSHYTGVTVLVRFSFVYCFCLLFVCLLVSVLFVCFAVYMSSLSACVHNLDWYLRFVYRLMAKIQ